MPHQPGSIVMKRWPEGADHLAKNVIERRTGTDNFKVGVGEMA
jgi:hypothetical protein